MAPSRHDWKIVDWDVKPQHNQPTESYCTTAGVPVLDTPSFRPVAQKINLATKFFISVAQTHL